MKEGNVQNLGRMRASKEGAKTFRNQVGGAWVAPPNRTKKFKKGGKNYVILEEPTWLNYGLMVGSSDTIGWKPTLITLDMVGSVFARFLGIEYKTDKGKPSKEQITWHEALWRDGGLTGFARSDDDVSRIINGEKVDP